MPATTAKPRVLYLTQWYDPEPTFKGSAFARGLIEAGLDTDVATGFPNYPGGKVYAGYRIRPIQRERRDDVRITRLALYPNHDRSSIGRMLNYGSFFLSALLYGLLRAGRYDVVYVYHPPMTVGFAAALFGAIRRKPFILEIQDLWPESVVESGMGSRRLITLIEAMCNFVYRRAQAIVVQSNGMRGLLIDRGVPAAKVHVVINWANEDALQPKGGADLAMLGLEGRVTFLYAGSLGALQGLDHVVHAAAHAHARDPRIQVVLMGSGTERERLAALAAEIAPGAVRVLPGVPITEIADVIAAADILLIHIADRPLFAVTIPSKTQFYLASGKPVLAALPGEAGEIVRASEAGEVVAPEDPVALGEAMIRMSSLSTEERAELGRRGRRYYDANLSFPRALRQTQAVIRAVLAR